MEKELPVDEDRQTSFYDQVLDELLPDDFDWREMVMSYPMTAVTVSFLGGIWLGRSHGNALISGLMGFAMREATRNVQGFVDNVTRHVEKD